MSVGSTRFIALWIGATSLAIPVAGLAAGPDPANYPVLSTQQMGHVRHMINLADQLDGDWSMMGEADTVTPSASAPISFRLRSQPTHWP